MRFNCGLTWEANQARLEQWHPFFALWPRVIHVDNGNCTCAWLETIQRKGTLATAGYDQYWHWDYKA